MCKEGGGRIASWNRWFYPPLTRRVQNLKGREATGAMLVLVVVDHP